MKTKTKHEIEPPQKHEDIRGYLYEYPEIVDYMIRKIDRVAHIVTRTDKLQFYIEHNLNNYIDKGQEDIPLMKNIVNKEIGKYLKGDYSKQNTIPYTQLSRENDYGDVIQFDIKDETAEYEEKVVYDDEAKKMIALFCKSDQEIQISTELYRGKSKKEIAECLATEQSIQKDSAMKNINRFLTRNKENAHLYIRIA